MLVEIKNITNVSKPFQKVKDADLDDGEKEMKIGPKKGQMFSMIAHDGVRFLKLVLIDFKINRLWGVAKFFFLKILSSFINHRG